MDNQAPRPKSTLFTALISGGFDGFRLSLHSYPAVNSPKTLVIAETMTCKDCHWVPWFFLGEAHGFFPLVWMPGQEGMGEDQKSFFPILTQDCSAAPLIIQGIILATVKVAKSFCFCCYAWHVLLSEDISQ